MGRLDGKVAVITGGGRGQGRAHAVTLAAEGADIVICDAPGDIATIEYGMATAEDMQETVRLVEKAGRRCVAVEADVRDTADMARLAERTMDELGRVDALVCNAGVMSAADSTWELTDDQWRDMLDVNVTGVWKVCRAIVPHMIAGKRGGAITITGSTGGLRSVAGCTHYNVAKHGCIALMRTLAWELAPEMIRVNVVHPTGVNTEMSNNEWFAQWIQEHDRLAGPMRGNLMPVDVVQPEDVSKMIAFLVSDDARYVTGTEVRVDAGFMLK
ncbi:mycofactocin-coupled SDR family oxidoreductase [Pseudonocardia sp. MH-G8]|uniref:mycofactocin-coupled SDR family oxidoreductase n=1 Tax=Pseudonocardia sp. MH-G8 TaxID=1854588 RepID=UPI000BA0402A|nr:mycofactocin-coupled SDR family oxidoreductase [Pseudonocardia sp. MH-G8]OZM77887.1 SDR family mycofactocin-dependent oxidoreductase [Pseudonocardia sp. MH-G8]